MLGYIKKDKVLRIINSELDQLNDEMSKLNIAELKTINMAKEQTNQDKEDYKKSINEINGAKRVLQELIKHFI